MWQGVRGRGRRTCLSIGSYHSSLRGIEWLERRLVLSTLRVASWNVFDRPVSAGQDADFETVLQAIGNESIAGTSKRLDIMTLAEADSTNANRLEDVLDGLYSTNSYEYMLASPDAGGDHTGFIYDTSSVQLVNTTQIASGMSHPALRGQFRPLGTVGDVDFFVYTIHLKAFGSADDMAQRESEMITLRQNADALGEGANILMTGDFNLTGGSSAEGAWTEAYAPGAGMIMDAADAPGNWGNNSSFKHLHTWSSGDLRSRLDFHFFSGELQDGVGLEYVAGSVRPFGNNGTHTFSQSVTTGSGAAPNVLSALVAASDHLPVVSDYEFDVDVVIAESGAGTSVTEGGAGDSYTVALASAPTANVTVTVTPDDQVDLGAGPAMPITLTFMPSNATTPQTVNVMAVDDMAQEGTQLSQITHTTSSSDNDFHEQSVPDVSVTVFDNESVSVVINEVDADTVSTDMLEFVELYDGGVGNTALAGLSLVFFNGNGDVQYAGYDLAGFTTNADGFFVLGNAAVPNVDFVIADNSVQNGADAVGLFLGSAASYTNVTTTDLIDAVVYDTDDADDVGLLSLLNIGQPQVNERAGGNGTGHSNSRVPDGGTPRNTDVYVTQPPTPGTYNAEPPALDGDFDGNLDYDCADVDALVAAIAGGNNPVAFDLTNDMLVDGDDLTAWLAIAGAANLPGGGSFLPGDATLDGLVNAADFQVWNQHKFTQNAAWCAADFTADGFVDGADLLVWNANKNLPANVPAAKGEGRDVFSSREARDLLTLKRESSSRPFDAPIATAATTVRPNFTGRFGQSSHHYEDQPQVSEHNADLQIWKI